MKGLGFAVVLAVAILPLAVEGQGSGCEFLEGTTSVTSRTPGGNRVTYSSTPRIRCDDGRYMQADSALQFEASGYSEFIGDVLFRDRGRTLQAEQAAYYENLGRLEARGDVVLVQPDGNEVRGERLLYLRAGSWRASEELTVLGDRPEAVLYVDDGGDAGGARPAPYLVEADRIRVRGEDFFEARGFVELERDSLTATADSLDYDQVGGALLLWGRPANLVRGELDLVGERIRVLLPGDVIEEVVAREKGLLTTDSLTVDAHFIRIFLTEGEVRRLVAAVPPSSDERAGEPEAGADLPPPPGGERSRRTGEPGAGPGEEEVDSLPRAVATTRDIVMRADSLDVLAPGQRLQRMVAVGAARAVSMARDSLNAPGTPDLLRYDWIEGDTVVALFEGYVEGDTVPGPEATNEPETAAAEPAPEGDGAGEGAARLESLRAVVGARSLYRLDPDSTQLGDTTTFRARLPATYVEARGIRLTFQEGQVVRFLYDGLQRGQQLQPVRLPGEVPDTSAAPAVPVDTAAVPVDTVAGPGGGVPPGPGVPGSRLRRGPPADPHPFRPAPRP